jgi:hypothetical protein
MPTALDNWTTLFVNLAKPPFEGKIKKNGYVKTNKI